MRILRILPLFLMLLALFACSSMNSAKKTSMTGQAAPDFSLPDQDGRFWKLSEVVSKYRGAVLAFYPKDDTKLWIREFVEFQQNIKQYKSRRIKILGLSRDSAGSHRKFIAKHGLADMTLLVDEKGKIAKMYNADHPVLPLSKRVYVVVDGNMKIIYMKDMGFDLLDNQTQTLIREIDARIR